MTTWTVCEQYCLTQTDKLRVTLRTDCLKRNDISDTDTLKWQADIIRVLYTDAHNICISIYGVCHWVAEATKSCQKTIFQSNMSVQHHLILSKQNTGYLICTFLNNCTENLMFLSPSCKNPPIFNRIYHGDPFFFILMVPVSLNPMLQISPQHLFQLMAEKAEQNRHISGSNHTCCTQTTDHVLDMYIQNKWTKTKRRHNRWISHMTC